MAIQLVQFHRTALLDLVRGPWSVLWLVTPALQAEALRPLLPHLDREGASVRLLTDLSLEALAEGRVELAALQRLRKLPGCEIRGLPDLGACLYAADPGWAIVSGAPLTAMGLDSQRTCGATLPESGPLLADLARWWESASQLSNAYWSALADRVGQRREAQRVGAEIARLGAFVRVSVRGTRRSRRLDPKEFGVVDLPGTGRAVRPAEVIFYKLDELIRAKEELEAVLADQGLEWNGQYLVPRTFLERDWPSLFERRQRQLQERLNSKEYRSRLKAQLQEARRELEGWLGSIYPLVDSDGLPGDRWVDLQATRVLSEAVIENVLEEGALEYRVLTILPEDRRSIEEMDGLLQEPKLRSVQLTFPI